LALLQAEVFEETMNPYRRKSSIQESKEILKGYDGLISGTESRNEEVLNTAESLKYLCRLGAGMDNVDFEAAEKQRIKVENTPSAHVDGVAELTLGGILSSLRGMATAHANLTQGNWQKPMGTLLRGKTVGIIGLGQVGKRLVALLKPFEVKILAYDPFQDADFAKANEISFVDLTTIAAQSDIITMHIPFTKDAKHMIDQAFLSKCKKSAVIVNASRGGLINEVDLLKFLSANPAASAYLDTFEQESYHGALCAISNCMLTPHIGSYASEVRINMEMEAAKNVINFFKK
jgi:D-3-phosphoglycerate dehydrogenase